MTNPATIGSLRALAAGFVFGMTFVMGGYTGSDVDQRGNRVPLPATFAINS